MAGRKLRFDPPETETVRDSVSSLTVDALRDAAAAEPDEYGSGLPAAEPEARPAVVPEPHALERAIQQELLNQSDVRFSSLVVRRFRDGVCLQGVIEVENDVPDVERLTRELSGLDRVMNHLVVRRLARDV